MILKQPIDKILWLEPDFNSIRRSDLNLLSKGFFLKKVKREWKNSGIAYVIIKNRQIKICPANCKYRNSKKKCPLPQALKSNQSGNQIFWIIQNCKHTRIFSDFQKRHVRPAKCSNQRRSVMGKAYYRYVNQYYLEQEKIHGMKPLFPDHVPMPKRKKKKRKKQKQIKVILKMNKLFNDDQDKDQKELKGNEKRKSNKKIPRNKKSNTKNATQKGKGSMKKNAKGLWSKDNDLISIDMIGDLNPGSKTYRILAKVVNVPEQSYMKRPNGKYKTLARAILRGQDGSEILTTRLSKKMRRELSTYKRKGITIEARVKIRREIVNRSKKIEHDHIQIVEIRPSENTLDLLEASRKERKLVKAFLKTKRKKGLALFNCIFEAVIELLQIVVLPKDIATIEAIEVMICQAFSGGFIKGILGKIHTLFIGPPAVGKGKILTVGKLLNIFYEESQGETTTPSGLAGTPNKKNDKWKIDPGAIFKASKGLASFEDIHKSKYKNAIFSFLSDVTQTGKVVIQSAAREEMVAETAIHLDENRQSDIFLDKAGTLNTFEDIGMPANLISRLDYISIFPLYEDLEFKKLLMDIDNMSQKSLKSEIARYCDKNGIDIDRFLKLIVAYVMDEFNQINIDPVNKEIKKKLKQIKKAAEFKSLRDKRGTTLTQRNLKTFYKFIHALTRIQLRHKANSKAVDKAFQFLIKKLQIVNSIYGNSSIQKSKSTKPSKHKHDCIHGWIVKKTKGRNFSREDLIKKYHKKGDPVDPMSDSTLRERISEIADQVEHGKWKVRKDIIKRFSKSP